MPNDTAAPIVPGTVEKKTFDCQRMWSKRQKSCVLTIARFVCVLEDLAARHVAYAVAQEGAGRDDGLFGAAGDVGGDEGPGEEEGEDVWDGDEV
jgi:hypothetical protein